MSELPSRGYFAAGLVFVCAALVCSPLNSQEIEQKQPITTVRAEDIGKTVVIQGRMGHPLGKLITIRGRWTDPGYKDSPILEVSLVDGRKLDKPVMVCPGQVVQIHHFWKGGRKGKVGESWDWHFEWKGELPPPRPTLGQTWEMIGVETGTFDQHSKETWNEVGGPYVGMPSYMHDFWSRFEFIAVKIEDGKLR